MDKKGSAVWKSSVKRALVQGTVQKTFQDQYRRVLRTPEQLLDEMLENNTTHFSADELKKLLLSFKRVTTDRFQVGANDIGMWSFLLRTVHGILC